MAKTSDIHPSDLVGFGRLAVDATAGLSAVVEALHHNIARAPGILDTPSSGPTTGITGLVYESIRSVAGVAGVGIDAILAPHEPLPAEKQARRPSGKPPWLR